MKKIVILVPSLQDKGPIIIAKDIARYCKDKEIKMEFISLRKNKDEDLKNIKEYKIYEVGMGKLPYKVLKLKKIVNAIEPDLIHCHGFWPTILAVLILNRYKLISTIHNNPNEDFSYRYGKFMGKILTTILLFFQKKLYLNVTISKYIEDVHKKMGLKNIITIYNGIPQSKYINQNNDFYNEDFFLITVSVLNKVKNVSFLIEVIKNLKKYIPKVKLKIIGNGQERKKLEAKVKQYMLEENIIFLGEKKREEIYSEVIKNDIFVFSSLSEGFGLVVAEALMLKVPVVTNNIPVMKEMIIQRKNGIICNLDVNEYIEAILEIKKNLEQYKKNTRIYFNKNFFVENMSKNYIELYKKLLK